MADALFMNAGKGTAVGTATIDASTDLCTISTHGLADGDTVTVDTLTGGAVGVLTTDAVYYVRDATANTFGMAATLAGPLVDFSTAGGADVYRYEPQYHARELRACMATVLQLGSTSRLVGARAGVRPGGDQLLVLLSGGTTILVEAGCCVVDPAISIESGPYLCAFTAQTNLGPIDAPHATLVRVDIVYVEVEDDTEDSSGQRRAHLEYLAGTPGAGQPATPSGRLLLAAITVPQSGGGSATVTDARTFSPTGPLTVVFTVSGSFAKASYPWARAVKIRLVGGGGGGGGAAISGAGTSALGGGGGGGGYAEKWVDVNALSASETVTVGAAGAASAAGANPGGTGGTSSFGAHCSATGGAGGSGGAATAVQITSGGAGGAGSGGDVNIPGHGGDIARVTGGFPVDAAGGGDSILGFGAFKSTSINSVNGSGGQSYGGGGGGALNRDTGGSVARSGGAGATGIVIVEVH